MNNRLADAASPYLRQHADNPVHWQPWDEAAFALARTTGKPILLSIGYSACHWCHVMARECFEDPQIAEDMNALFVPIKVDREERPDLDRLYLGALAQLGTQAGWPLTAFLTPDGTPYAGGGYYPPRPAFGLPGFREVLAAASMQFGQDPERASERGGRALTAAAGGGRASGAGTLSPVLLDRVANQLARSMDTLYGGFGIDPPKFLYAGGHEILLRGWARSGETGLLDAVSASMRLICDSGVYDHVGGGFHRYAADDRWQVPHFEKMLCDNAVMLGLLVKLWQATGDEVFAERVAQTIGWLAEAMRLPDGGLAASLDAEAAGGEGAFYTWPAEALAEALGETRDAFHTSYEAATDGPFEGRAVLLRRPGTPAAPGAMARLRRARAERAAPARDDKLLADWNGLAVSALASAGLAFERADWVALAGSVLSATIEQLGGVASLRHSVFAGLPGPAAFLDDYANLAAAALALYEATGEMALVGIADGLVGQLDRDFWDASAGGYFFAATAADGGPVRACLIDETTAPAGNGTMLAVLPRLAMLTGEMGYLQRAEAILSRFADRMSRASIAAATALNNGLAPQRLIQIVIVGDAQDAATLALTREATRRLIPDRLLVPVAAGQHVPEAHPAAGKPMLAGRPTAYLCIGQTCLAPVSEPAALGALIDGLAPGQSGRKSGTDR